LLLFFLPAGLLSFFPTLILRKLSLLFFQIEIVENPTIISPPPPPFPIEARFFPFSSTDRSTACYFFFFVLLNFPPPFLFLFFR